MLGFMTLCLSESYCIVFTFESDPHSKRAAITVQLRLVGMNYDEHQYS